MHVAALRVILEYKEGLLKIERERKDMVFRFFEELAAARKKKRKKEGKIKEVGLEKGVCIIIQYCREKRRASRPRVVLRNVPVMQLDIRENA